MEASAREKESRLRFFLKRLWAWLPHLPRRGQDWGLFLIFMVIASMLWFFNKLNHEYTIDIDSPLHLYSAPAGELLVGDPERTVRIRIHGNGYVLMKYKGLRNLRPFELNLRNLWPILPSNRISNTSLTSRQLTAIIGSQLPAGVTLNAVLTDTMLFEFSHLAQRRVPVSPRVEYSLADQHLQSREMTLFPDSVWVSGPESTIDRMHHVETEIAHLGVLREEATLGLTLTPPPDVEVKPGQVTVQIPVSQYTEKSFRIAVEPKGVPDTLRMTLLPAHVTLKCNVPLEEYSSLKASSFKLSATLDPLSHMNSLRVNVDSIPASAYEVDFEPKSVQYLIVHRERGENR